MLTWLNFGILLLKLAQLLINWVGARQQFQAGQDAEIAKTALSIVRKTAYGKAIMEKIDAMDAGELDDFTDHLGRDRDYKGG